MRRRRESLLLIMQQTCIDMMLLRHVTVIHNTQHLAIVHLLNRSTIDLDNKKDLYP